MTIQIQKIKIPYQDKENEVLVNAFLFIPDVSEDQSKISNGIALFTHGFTSHKGSILNWNLRLAEEGTPSMLFDLPGHYLGGFTEVSCFETFKTNAAKLFHTARETLLQKLQEELPLNSFDDYTIIGGHSLGGLLSLKAAELPEFSNLHQLQVIAVGFGLPPKGVTHIFDTPFYKSTLAVRAQLVAPELNPDVVFPWIKKEKEELALTGKNIYLLTGKDDVVVGSDGSERLEEQLRDLGNNVVLERPAKLAHHVPENAAPHIKKWLKDQGFFQK